MDILVRDFNKDVASKALLKPFTAQEKFEKLRAGLEAMLSICALMQRKMESADFSDNNYLFVNEAPATYSHAVLITDKLTKTTVPEMLRSISSFIFNKSVTTDEVNSVVGGGWYSKLVEIQRDFLHALADDDIPVPKVYSVRVYDTAGVYTIMPVGRLQASTHYAVSIIEHDACDPFIESGTI